MSLVGIFLYLANSTFVAQNAVELEVSASPQDFDSEHHTAEEMIVTTSHADAAL